MLREQKYVAIRHATDEYRGLSIALRISHFYFFFGLGTRAPDPLEERFR